MSHEVDGNGRKGGNRGVNGMGHSGAGIHPALFIALIFVVNTAWGQTNMPAAAVAGASSAAAPAAGFIAGLQPDQRPQGAPLKAERSIDDKLLERRMHGVSKPWPGNVEQIARNGEWWVPLRHAGMTPPYDIRGWHHNAPVIKQ